MNIFKKISLLLKARKVLKEVTTMDKNKWFEREFILNAMGIAATIWGMLDGFIPKEWGLKIVAGLVIIYTICRSVIKLAAVVASFTKSTKDDEFVAKITKVLDVIGEKIPAKETNTATTNVTVNTPAQ